MYTFYNIQCYTYNSQKPCARITNQKYYNFTDILCVHDFIYSSTVKYQYTSYVHINMHVNTHAPMYKHDTYMEFVRHTEKYIQYTSSYVIHTGYWFGHSFLPDDCRARLCTISPLFFYFPISMNNEWERLREKYFSNGLTNEKPGSSTHILTQAHTRTHFTIYCYCCKHSTFIYFCAHTSFIIDTVYGRILNKIDNWSD